MNCNLNLFVHTSLLLMLKKSERRELQGPAFKYGRHNQA